MHEAIALWLSVMAGIFLCMRKEARLGGIMILVGASSGLLLLVSHSRWTALNSLAIALWFAGVLITLWSLLRLRRRRIA